MESELAAQQIESKREDQEQSGRKADDLLLGIESHLEDGATMPSLRQRGKHRGKGIHATRKGRNLETEGRKAEDGTGKGIIETGILEYNMTGTSKGEA